MEKVLMEIPELLIVLVIVGFLVFGAKRMPDAARGLGRSLRIFKAETKGLLTDDQTTTPAQIQAPTPVYAPPVQQAPVYAPPVPEAPVYAAPVQQAPVYAAPVQQAPVYAPPVQQAPAPVYAPPVQPAPVAAPAEQPVPEHHDAQ
jgi:TatA/E family protein of Tat protein translocase